MASPKEQVSRWVGLAAGIWVQALAGNSNVFPQYAPTLKHQLNLNQVELNSLGVAKDFGESVGLVAGMLSNLLSPWVILLIGALEGLFGFGTLWLVMTEYIAPLPYWQMCVVLIIASNSTTYFNTAVLVTTMRNFPESRGMVVGIVKGFVGLSSAIFTQVFIALLNDSAANLVLLLALGPFTVCLIVMYFIQPVGNSGDKKSADPREKSGFAFVHIVCIGLALYILFVASFESFVEGISPLVYQIIIAVMLAFLFAPLLVPAKFAYDYFLLAREKLNSHAPLMPAKVEDNLRTPLLTEEQANVCGSESTTESTQPEDNCPKDKDNPASSPRNSEPYFSYDKSKLRSENTDGEKETLRTGCLSESRSGNLEGDARTLLAVGEGAVRRRRGPRRGEDFTLSEALVKADFWLLFFSYFCGVGTGITVINNLGQIGQAQGYSDVSIFVSLFAVMNFLGRLGAGALSEHFVRSDALPRTVWMMVAQVLMILGHFLFATAVPGSLYMGSVVLGLCYGVHVAIMVPTASELFGLRHFGMIYNFMTMGNPLGSLLLSGILAGYLYDKESGKSPSVHGVDEHILARYFLHNPIGSLFSEASCLGPHCFQLTFFIMAMVCVVGFFLNLILTFRIRRVYRSLYGSKSFQDLSTASDKGSTPGSSP
ncbi:unnamed protein product [Calypogeia fissa]